MARDLAMGFAVIVDSPKIVATRHRSKRAIERQNFQTMAGQIEVANDLWSQQRDDVGAHGKLESRKDFFGDGRASEHVASLKHENFLSCTRQIGSSGEAVVTCADHDSVV